MTPLAAMQARHVTANMERVRCAAVRRRGGKPCSNGPCVCLGAEALMDGAHRLLGELLSTTDLTAGQRAAIVDWRRAREQRDLEDWAMEAAPKRLQRGVQKITDPEGIPRGTGLPMLRKMFRDHKGPAPTRVVADAIRWVQRHVATPIQSGRSLRRYMPEPETSRS